MRSERATLAATLLLLMVLAPSLAAGCDRAYSGDRPLIGSGTVSPEGAAASDAAGAEPAESGVDGTGATTGASWDTSPVVAESSATAPESPDYLARIATEAEFESMAARPLDGSIPGGRSVKTVVDRLDSGALYFQNSDRYPLHYDFVSSHLSGDGLPLVPLLPEFNATEYVSPSRRFLLGAVTYYADADVYCYEVAPFDTATPEMITEAFEAVERGLPFVDRLAFHPSSTTAEAASEQLPPTIPVVSTDEIFADTEFQVLNPAIAYGRLRIVADDDVDDTALSFRDIAVFESMPEDVGVLAGILTEQFQTPLSHLNVLSRNRGTPNLAVRGVFDDQDLRTLDGRWVRLEVGQSGYSITEVTKAEADTWWEARTPDAVRVPAADTSVTDLRDIAGVVDLESQPMAEALQAATRAFGGKAAHYAVLAGIDGLSVRPAFAVPVAYYFHFMADNGFDELVTDMLDDSQFQDDPEVRAELLSRLRKAMEEAPLDESFEAELTAKLVSDYPGKRIKFRSSTNAEDLGDYTGAGLYESKAAQVGNPESPVADAVKEVWASVWSLEAFEERSYRGIDHLAVGMALLAHESFADEEANGVALTNNPYDPTGLSPAFYVNVQSGETSVVKPPDDTTADAFLLYYDHPDQPVEFISHSSETKDGEPVLTEQQVMDLGAALAAVRDAFAVAYAPRETGESSWWAMDVEFKFDGAPGEAAELFVKQARPYR